MYSLVCVVAIVAVAADVAVAAVVVVSVVCLFVWLLACSGQCVGNEVSSAHWCHPFPRAWGDQPWRKWTDRALAEKHHATCGFHPASRHPFTGPQPFSRIALSCTLVLTHSIAECYRLLSFALLLLFFMSLSSVVSCRAFCSHCLASSISGLTHHAVHLPLWVLPFLVCPTIVPSIPCPHFHPPHVMVCATGKRTGTTYHHVAHACRYLCTSGPCTSRSGQGTLAPHRLALLPCPMAATHSVITFSVHWCNAPWQPLTVPSRNCKGGEEQGKRGGSKAVGRVQVKQGLGGERQVSKAQGSGMQ